MAQDGNAEGSSAEEPDLYPQHKCGLSQEDVVEASSMPGLKTEAGVWTCNMERFLREEPHGGANPQAEGVAEASLGLLERVVEYSTDSLLDSRFLKPTEAAQGQPWAPKRLQVSQHDFLAPRSSRNLCNMPLDVPKKVLACVERTGGVEGGICPRTGWAADKGMGSSGGDERSPTLYKEGPPGSSLLSPPGLPTRRARKKRRLCGMCSHDGEEVGDLLWLDQSSDLHSWPVGRSPDSADLRPFGKTRKSSPSKKIGPRDTDGSWVGCASGVKKFESMPSLGNEAKPGSLDDYEFPGLCGGESLRPATQASLQSLAPFLGVPHWASTEQWEVQPSGAGRVEGPCVSYDPEGSEVKAQTVSREELGRGVTAPANTWASFPEPSGGPCFSLEAATSKAGAGLPRRQTRSRCLKKPRRNPVPCVQEQHTVNPSQDDLHEAKPESCPRLLCSGEGIRLLGGISHDPSGAQPPKLEPLEDFMEVSSVSPTPRPRRRRKCVPRGSASQQCSPVETVYPESLQQGTEDSAQLQPEQESMPLDIGVRATVVRAMQEVLWSRLQELPELQLKEEEVEGIAVGIESALFHLTQDTNGRYKTKYRSLLFNLRDPRNLDLFLKVAQCDVTPHDLVRMSSIQLAPQELSRWRDQEERRGLELIEQQQKEPHRLPVSKMTHKGEVEISRDPDQMLTLEDLVEPMVPKDCNPQTPLTLPQDAKEQHQHSFLDPNSLISKDWQPSSELPSFLRTTTDRGSSAIQRAPNPDPVSSSEMPKAKETLPKELQYRLQMPAGPTNFLPSPPPWEGSIDMFSIKRFRAKAQLVSGNSCRLVQTLPEAIRSAGCLSPNTVWDLLASMCPAGIKDVCVVRLCPLKSRDIQNCRLLYSYLNNKQRHCLAAVEHIGVVLLPLPAFQPLPTRLRSLGGPGLEASHSSLLLAVLLPKEGLPDTASSSPLWGKVRKTVSFNSKVEMRCFQPEDRRGPPSPEVAPQKSQAKGSLPPRSICAWQRLPRDRESQGPGSGQQPSDSGGWQPQHLPAAPVVPGFGRGQHFHRASCLHKGLFQHLNALVNMNHQLQVSLWPQGQGSLSLPSAASAQPPAATWPPGPASTPSLGPAEESGSECLLPT